MADACLRAIIESAGIDLAVATTTELCRSAQAAHGLASTSTIALGRLLTAAALVGLTAKRRGSTSLQILTKSRLKQVFADVNHEGHCRGFVKNGEIAFPVLSGERTDGRRAIALALFLGKLSVVRSTEDGAYTQSTTDLVSGEVDLDVEHFLEQSDQIPTAMACDVLIGNDEAVELAGGILVQALPGANLDRLGLFRAGIRDDGLARALRAHRNDTRALLGDLAPDAKLVDKPIPILWKCRCSRPRVLEALRMLSSIELADMMTSGAPVDVGCDLCSASYVISLEEIQRIFVATVKAEA